MAHVIQQCSLRLPRCCPFHPAMTFLRLILHPLCYLFDPFFFCFFFWSRTAKKAGACQCFYLGVPTVDQDTLAPCWKRIEERRVGSRKARDPIVLSAYSVVENAASFVTSADDEEKVLFFFFLYGKPFLVSIVAPLLLLLRRLLGEHANVSVGFC